jgi:hypothetical protein
MNTRLAVKATESTLKNIGKVGMTYTFTAKGFQKIATIFRDACSLIRKIWPAMARMMRLIWTEFS